MRTSLFVLAVAAVGLVACLDVDDFYPFDKTRDHRLPRGDAVWSDEFALQVPVKYHGDSHSSLWVHTDGFVSFAAVGDDMSALTAADFPLPSDARVVAPFMTDLDTTEQGHVMYAESRDAETLRRGTDDVTRAFPDAARDFQASSVLVVTWKNVKGQTLEGEPASFTFQLAIVSGDAASYVVFLYPKSRMGSMEGMANKMFEAKTGFNFGGEKFMEMYPTEDLTDYDNTRRKGEWIFQIGGEGMAMLNDVVDPEQRRLVRRDALVNVQEVDLGNSFNNDDGNRRNARFYDYCARDSSACLVNNSQCVNHNEGFCCQCLDGYVGNGRICANSNQNLQISGNVTGTVDVRHSDRSVKRVQVDSEYQGFSIVSLGRAHAAMTPLDSELARALKPIVPVGQVSAWLFASSQSPAINGFDYTGGRMQRKLSIRFRDGGYRFDLRQRFHGAHFRGDELFVSVTGTCVGILPAVPADQQFEIGDVESTFIREASGRITMTSIHSYTAGGVTHVYDVTETIIFSECAESRNAVPSQLTLKMTDVFVQSDDDTVRWAQDAKVVVSDSAVPVTRRPHPCDDRDVCGRGQCRPQGFDYRCRCDRGYEEVFDRDGKSSCEILSEEQPDEVEVEVKTESTPVFSPCEVDDICGPGTCSPTANGFECLCPPGFVESNNNGYGSCVESQLPGNLTRDPCDGHRCGVGRCVAGADGEYQCNCPDGYEERQNRDGLSTCRQYRPRQSVCDNHDCDVGTCLDQRDGTYQCQCPRGYSEKVNRDGRATCEADRQTELRNPCEVAGICGRVGTCRSTGDSYRCDCPQGYVEFQDTYGSRCEDVDECQEADNICSPYANCNNYDGSYKCICKPGYTGDGRNCRPDEPSQGSLCEIERQFALERRRGYSSGDVPICTRDGDYERTQCTVNGATCWCVDPSSGVEVPDSRTDPGQGHLVECDPESSAERSECQRQREEAADEEARPECDDADGTFLSRQCSSFLQDVCWCVDRVTGAMIDGTVTEPGHGRELDCDGPADESECERRWREADERNHDDDDREYPDCDERGLFRRRQCAGFGDECWCVDPETGEELPEPARTRFRALDLDCEPPVLVTVEPTTDEPECRRVYRETREMFRSNPAIQDLDYPACTEEGLFERRQCVGFIDVCRCVNQHTGETIEGTVTEQGEGHNLNCDEDVSVRPSDPCDRDPCGQGRCISRDDGTYRCRCHRGYQEVTGSDGSTCQALTTEAPYQPSNIVDDEDDDGSNVTCARDPDGCGAGGTCVDIPNSHHRCRCRTGYLEVATRRGSSTCEQASDKCKTAENACSGHGECVAQRNTYRCRCDAGYEEYFVDGHGDCQSVSDSPCVGNPCGNGQCLPTHNTFRCRCDEGFHESFEGRVSSCEPDSTESGVEDESTTTTTDATTTTRQPGRKTTTTYRPPVVPDTTRYDETDEDEDNMPPPELTACQADVWLAQRRFNEQGFSSGVSFHEPACTDVGAYEPVQYQNGVYTCVDFNGLEISRHTTQPECMKRCELAAYYAQTENIFAGRDNFVPECDRDGEYEPVQCDGPYCSCVDDQGFEIEGTEVRIRSQADRRRLEDRCSRTSGGSFVERGEGAPPTKVIFAQAAGVHGIDLPLSEDSKAERLFTRQGRMMVGVDFDCSSRMVYFTDVRARSIFRAPVGDFSRTEVIVRRNLRQTEGIAVDHISGNVYWADAVKKRIEVARADGSMRTTLISKGVHRPRGLAVDPVGGKIYWTDWNRERPRIMWANMDGSDAKALVKDDLKVPNNLEIDLYHKKLCFIDAGTYKIECMNLDGSRRRVMAELQVPGARDKSYRMPFGLEVSGKHLYYTESKPQRFHVLNTETGEDRVFTGPMGVHGQMFGVALAYDECPQETNHCAVNNGGCSHLCLPVPNGKVCKCPRDARNCREDN